MLLRRLENTPGPSAISELLMNFPFLVKIFSTSIVDSALGQRMDTRGFQSPSHAYSYDSLSYELQSKNVGRRKIPP